MSVNQRMTPTKGNAEFKSFVGRILRAHGRRVADADPEALTDLLDARQQLDTAIDAAVVGLRAAGYSWADIARPLGITRQAAFKKWGDRG